MSFQKQAAELLERYRRPIALAVSRQIQAMVPRYQSVDREAITNNVKDVIEAVRELLIKGDERPVMGVLNVIMEIRRISGFSVGDFLVAVLCALPVLRRFFVNRAPSVDAGLAMYEAFEAKVLPLYGRIVINFVRLAEESDTFPEGMPTISALLGDDAVEEFSDPFFIAPVDEFYKE